MPITLSGRMQNPVIDILSPLIDFIDEKPVWIKCSLLAHSGQVLAPLRQRDGAFFLIYEFRRGVNNA
jgi:hypothetical protein